MESEFEQKKLYSLQDLCAIVAEGRITSMGIRAHLDKSLIPCEFKSRAQGAPTYFSPDNVLTIAIFYALTLTGMLLKPAARIIKRLPPDTWRDVADGFTRYLVTPLSGEGGIQFLSDIEELTQPKHPATVIIDLKAIRENVIRKVEETFEKRSKAKGTK